MPGDILMQNTDTAMPGAADTALLLGCGARPPRLYGRLDISPRLISPRRLNAGQAGFPCTRARRRHASAVRASAVTMMMSADRRSHLPRDFSTSDLPASASRHDARRTRGLRWAKITLFLLQGARFSYSR